MPEVTRRIVPAKTRQELYGDEESKNNGKLRVAAYARVSTEFEEQANSFQNQQEYFMKLVKEHDDWEFVGLYSDDGISAKSASSRPGFLKMIADCRLGKIDKIITKSISRFARNTKDCLEYTRELRSKGIPVYFEKEGLDSNDPNTEFILTIMASLAEEESRSLGRNVRWTVQKKMEKGIIMQNITQLLGFDKDENKNLVVNPEQAKTIKRIYAEFGEGKTPIEIADGLTQDGILTPTKKTKWIPGTILTILKNEKYKGDAIFQKTYQKDFLDKRVKNEGQAPMYIFTNHHEAIIDREYWDWVQMEIKRRIESCHEEGHRAYSLSGHPMAGMLICGECGSYLRRYRQNRSATVYADTWICKKHVDEGRSECSALPVYQLDLMNLYMRAMNKLLIKNDPFRISYEESKKALNEKNYKDEIKTLDTKMNAIQEEIMKNIDLNSRGRLTDEDMNKRNRELQRKYEVKEKNMEALKWDNYMSNLSLDAIKLIDKFIKKGEPMRFDLDMVDKTVDTMCIEMGGAFVTLTLKGGAQIKEVLVRAPGKEKKVYRDKPKTKKPAIKKTKKTNGESEFDAFIKKKVK